jgi:hypothetical protein
MRAPTEEDLQRWLAPIWHSRKWNAADAAHIVWARWITSPMQTQRTIAQHFGVTASRIHQIEHHLVATLARNTSWSADEPEWGEWLASEAPLATAIREARQSREEGAAFRRELAERQAAIRAEGYEPCPACNGTGKVHRAPPPLPRSYVWTFTNPLPPGFFITPFGEKDVSEKPTE